MKHGQILGGIVTTPDLAGSLADYQGRLGLSLVEEGVVSPGLAKSWGCPASSGARMATLQPQSGAPCFLRLVEQDRKSTRLNSSHRNTSRMPSSA